MCLPIIQEVCWDIVPLSVSPYFGVLHVLQCHIISATLTGENWAEEATCSRCWKSSAGIYTPFFSRVQNSSALRRSISWFSSLMCAVLLTFWLTCMTSIPSPTALILMQDAHHCTLWYTLPVLMAETICVTPQGSLRLAMHVGVGHV